MTVSRLCRLQHLVSAFRQDEQSQWKEDTKSFAQGGCNFKTQTREFKLYCCQCYVILISEIYACVTFYVQLLSLEVGFIWTHGVAQQFVKLCMVTDHFRLLTPLEAHQPHCQVLDDNNRTD